MSLEQIIKAARVEKQLLDDGELALINAQTLTPKTADSLFVFRLCACDNQVDRDMERFTEGTLDALAELFVGRPVLRDHSWSANSQTARIYAAGVEMADGVKRLILRAYMPRTSRTANTIADIEAGILREASVGVAVERSLCSICGEDFLSCPHARGEEYDGKICHVDLDGARDAYEVSFVAVPAQKDAGVVKRYEDKEKNLLKNPSPEVTGHENTTAQLEAEALQALEEKRFGGM